LSDEFLHFKNDYAKMASILKKGHQTLPYITEALEILFHRNHATHQMEFTDEIFPKLNIRTKNFIFHLLQTSLR
jgi:hypothetical protein